MGKLRIGKVIGIGVLVLLAGIVVSCQCSGPAAEEEAVGETPEVAGVDWSTYVERPYDDGAELIDIPGGTYMMGSSGDTAPENETPAHEVSVPGFQIYSHEVTNEMYWKCVERHECMYPGLAGTDTMKQFSDETYADYPVIGVDWHMAKDYCEFVGGRLPTEAEWELAARGLDNFTYPWGEALPTCDLLNMKACITPEHSVPGGSYPDGRSPYGLYDMSGNVWEWVNDWYAEDGYGTAGSYGPNEGEEKVLRGGGYLARPESVTTTVRQASSPDRAYDDVGFRCVKNAPVIPAEIEIPEERHVPTTPPDDGLEGDEPDEPGEIWMEMYGAGCQLERGFQAFFHIGFDSLTISAAQLHIFDTVTLTEAVYPCTIESFDPDTLLILCNAEIPPSMPDDHPPAWVFGLLELTIDEWDHVGIAEVGFEITPCMGPDDWSGMMTASLSCPDGGGVTTLSVHHEFTPLPDFINYQFDLWDMSTCTSFYAADFTCTGVMEAAIDPHLIRWQFSYDGDPGMYGGSAVIAPPDDCAPTSTVNWGGKVLCSDTGGYIIRLYTDGSFPYGVSFASGGGGLFPCVETGPGAWDCEYLPPDPPEPDVTIQICPNLSDGTPGSCTTYHYPFPVDPCGTPEGGDWSIIETGCLDETQIYFIVDTGLAWLVPGASWTRTALDGESSYVCNVDPVVPGRVRCEGNRPAAPGSLLVQIQQDGAPLPTSVFFDDWPARVAAIPDCILMGGEAILTSYGCDPATGRFFCILNVNIPGVEFVEYQVHTNVSGSTCSLIDTLPDRIYCYTGWDPAIDYISFSEIDPIADFSTGWAVAPEPCPTSPPPTDPCRIYDGNSAACKDHYYVPCYWRTDLTCRSTP